MKATTGRWAVVAWYDHYPSGGLGNIVAQFPTKEEAEAHAKTIKYQWDCVEVEDLQELIDGSN